MPDQVRCSEPHVWNRKVSIWSNVSNWVIEYPIALIECASPIHTIHSPIHTSPTSRYITIHHLHHDISPTSRYITYITIHHDISPTSRYIHHRNIHHHHIHHRYIHHLHTSHTIVRYIHQLKYKYYYAICIELDDSKASILCWLNWIYVHTYICMSIRTYICKTRVLKVPKNFRSVCFFVN
jgi:hypothetical protein